MSSRAAEVFGHVQRVECEMALLGSAMIHPPAAKGLLATVRPEDFWSKPHRTLCGVIQDMAQRGLEADFTAVAARLALDGQLEAIGGVEGLLACGEAVGSATNWENYASIVLEYAARQRLYESAMALARATVDPEHDLERLRASASRLVEAVPGERRLLYEVEDIDFEDVKPGVCCGIAPIDDATECKGFPPGQVTVVAADAKIGKTSFLVQAALYALDRGARVLYATFADLDRSQLLRRMVRQKSGWERRPETLDLQPDYDGHLRGIKQYTDLVVYDSCGTQSGNTVELFDAAVRSMPRPPALILVDYAQRVRSSVKDDRVRSQEKVSNVIADLARYTGCAVVVGSQTDNNGGPRYSREWGMDAGLLIQMTRERNASHVEAAITLNRFGPPSSFPLGWDSKRLRFTS